MTGESKELHEALENFLACLKASVESIARTAEKAQQQARHENFIGTREAATFLKMSVATLAKRMKEDDGPPRYVDGGKISFLRAELRIWCARRNIEPQEAIEP